MIFPKVVKRFGRLGSAEKLAKTTLKFVSASLLAAGLVSAVASQGHAAIADVGRNAVVGRVIVLPVAPSVSITDGTTFATHYSHSSHASHASHGSHCSGYSWC